MGVGAGVIVVDLIVTFTVDVIVDHVVNFIKNEWYKDRRSKQYKDVMI